MSAKEIELERHKTLSDYEKRGPRVRVGADIDAWCTKCRMVLTHTIMVMEAGEPIRVQCNTCGSQHKFRKAPKGHSRTRSVEKQTTGTWAPTPGPKASKAWYEATSGKDLSNPVAYHPKNTYEVGDVLMHGKFGTGIVMGTKEGGKIIVVFEDGTRILVHGR